MADRVHPHTLPTVSTESQSTTSTSSPKPTPPTGGTYVIQIPKEQVYRVPPPENARRYTNDTRRKTRRSRFCRCCCCCLCCLIALVVLLAIAAVVLFFLLRPEAPNYNVESVAVSGMNLTRPSVSAAISPEFDVAVRAANGNKKIGIYYEKGSSVEMFYKDVRLCDGALPAFYQPSNNVTVFETALRGNGIALTGSDRSALLKAVTQRRVPLTLKLRAPVKIKAWSVKTWKITVKVDCDVTVDKLTAQARIVQKDCRYGVELW